MTIINEAGLYSLILGSRKPEAKAFKRWVTHEVLPSIRKTGKYETPTRKQQDEAAQKRLAVMELNAKIRQAKLIFDVTQKFKDRLSDIAIQSMLAVGANLLTGKEVLPLPTTERLYTATEIAEELGVSANAVCRAANQLGLKTDEFGTFVLDKSPYPTSRSKRFGTTNGDAKCSQRYFKPWIGYCHRGIPQGFALAPWAERSTQTGGANTENRQPEWPLHGV